MSNLGFYRVVQVPGLPQARPVLTIQLGTPPCVGGQLRLSWLAAFPGFTLQYAFSPVGPWFDANLPVTIVGNDFVVCDTLGAAPKFYRLLK